ncbi:MAG: DUF5666 domain-containing protein [Desulfobulbus sp.]|nr:DUF5666 domain-containing protein [Desulfobulbus sp.]
MCMGITAFLFMSLAPPAVFSSENDCYEHSRRIGEMEQLPTGYRTKMYGTVETLPENGLSGVWVVNGRQVVVTKDTFLEEKHGTIKPGAFVEIKAMQSGDILTATKVEVKRAKASGSPAAMENTMSGTIENLPKGLLGTWVVSGKEILVLKETVITGKKGQPEIGAPVQVQGTVLGETFIVSRIEIKQDGN